MAWKHRNKPASGIPAGGDLGHGGAKGSGSRKPKSPPFEPGNKFGAVPADKERQAWRKQKAWEMENHLAKLAEDGEIEATRVAAAAKLHAICDGMPVSRTEVSGPGGAPLQSISTLTVDPVEAAKLYQQIMGNK